MCRSEIFQNGEYPVAAGPVHLSSLLPGKGSKDRFLQRAVLELYGKDFAQSTLELDNRKRLRIHVSRSFFSLQMMRFFGALG